MGVCDGAFFFLLTAKIIDNSLGNARQATALMSVNNIQSMKLIDYRLLNEQFVSLFFSLNQNL
jgi:hypothetical protein